MLFQTCITLFLLWSQNGLSGFISYNTLVFLTPLTFIVQTKPAEIIFLIFFSIVQFWNNMGVSE